MKSLMKVRFGVLGAVLGLALMAGCSAETSETAAGTETVETLASSIDELTVVGEMRADGTISAEARDAKGERVLSLVVRGQVAHVELFGREGIGEGTFTVPPDPENKRTLASWNAFASYLAHALPQTTQDQISSPGLAPRMLRAKCSIFDICCAGGTVCDAMAMAWWQRFG
jgi:hypothetical protein